MTSGNQDNSEDFTYRFMLWRPLTLSVFGMFAIGAIGLVASV